MHPTKILLKIIMPQKDTKIREIVEKTVDTESFLLYYSKKTINSQEKNSIEKLTRSLLVL